MPNVKAQSQVLGKVQFEALNVYDGRPKMPPEFIYKTLCIYSYMVKLQSPSINLHLMPCTYQDLFSTAQNSFLIHQFWCLVVLLPFLFHVFHTGKTFPFEEMFSFIWGKQSCVGWDEWTRRVGHGGHCSFLVQNCWTLSMVWAGVLIKHPLQNRHMCGKSL